MIPILAIDGGGMRGVIPAVVLRCLEERLGRPIAGVFDLVAGTSTGGILALGLAVPGADGRPRYSAADLVEFYHREGPVIFRRTWWDRVRSAAGLADQRYPSAGIEGALERAFGSALLSECLTEVLVTAWLFEQERFHVFKRRKARENHFTDDLLVAAAARATAAAPTFFEPALAGHILASYIDGGVTANQPAVCALAEACRLWPGEEYLVVSIGTGYRRHGYRHEDAIGWGALHWLKPILNILMAGPGDAADYQMQHLPCRYYRLQVELTQADDDMADASPRQLAALEAEGERLIEQEAAAIDEVVELVR